MSFDERAPTTPVSVITGFLGSGKTTLLQNLLRHPDMADAAVLINEFGEIGLDHVLVQAIAGEILVLQSGCLCCAVRDDFIESLRDLYARRARGEVPAFRRVIIETSGLADPAPIIGTVLTNPHLSLHYRPDHVVTAVDAVLAESQRREHSEWVKQVALADRVILTKTDLASTEAVAAVRHAVRRINPIATLIVPEDVGQVDLASMFEGGPGAVEPGRAVSRWPDEGSTMDTVDHAHDHRVRSVCLTIPTAVEWNSFMAWLDSLVADHGRDLLRLKGVLAVAGREWPLAVQGVQHMLFPPREARDWPTSEHRSVIVLITRGLDRDAIAESLHRAIGIRPD